MSKSKEGASFFLSLKEGTTSCFRISFVAPSSTTVGLERPVAPYRVDIPVEERGVVAQRHGLLPDDPEMRDKLSDWYGSPCYQDEQGYYYVSSENPHGYWDGWILHDVQTDVYRLPDASMSGIDPLAVLTPDGVWHEMPYRWNETTQQTAQRQHLVEQVLAHYPAYLAVRLDCHR
jgi:hypothetical protein